MDQIVFQLTTSRRGRRILTHRAQRHTYFNSLPHAEVDMTPTAFWNAVENFNSLPHAEVDNSAVFPKTTHWTFQLTTSRRGRREKENEMNKEIVISTHYLTQR